MAETPAGEVTEELDETASPDTVHCRHCGQPHEVQPGSDPDFLCDACGRYQDSMLCPTCKQPARISLMPQDLVPEPHAPARRRKAG